MAKHIPTESRVIVKRVINLSWIPKELLIEVANFEEFGEKCYVPYSLENLEEYSALDTWIAKNYQELDNTEFLIHMDY